MHDKNTPHRADWTIDQNWEAYTDAEHTMWKTLFYRQSKILQNRATPEFMEGLSKLKVAADGIPDFRRLSDVLIKYTGWQVVPVPCIIPDEVFFEHLANKRFVSTCFIRRPDQMDYLQEPDIFHDTFGHVPLLTHPFYAEYMQAYGKAGLQALSTGNLKKLTRLFWYTIEFGLIKRAEGLRIYGAGIVSSKGESVYCLEDKKPQRIAFDLERVMQTDYYIDRYQDCYFVIDSFEQLFKALSQNLQLVYDKLKNRPDIPAGHVLPSDRRVAA
ncbi:MAG TPA: phenylalanine 4-monooxygenase [Alphaproteobacteria bacterium]|jgi:phenylalanine-4-hydroxylase|nr:phenylalanine 4-monooxygenase [Alphaproteobacteria bacterium]